MLMAVWMAEARTRSRLVRRLVTLPLAPIRAVRPDLGRME